MNKGMNDWSAPLTRDALWPAPAKLNLFLHLTGRRRDGYHELQTVFQFLDFGDELNFDMRTDGEVRRLSGLSDVPADEDLVVRAARLLQMEAGGSQGVDIHLHKRIPLGAGLGGGSSDAATTLVALNHLWGLGLPTDRLAAMGLTLGADVPVFVRGAAAWAEGVGEHLTPIDLPEPWYLVVTPGCRISTREIFNHPDLKRNSAPITMPQFLAGAARNDCLPVVRKRYPEVGEALDFLTRLNDGRSACLTGTGASVFAVFDTREAALRARNEVPSRWECFAARGLNRSPLLTRAALV